RLPNKKASTAATEPAARIPFLPRKFTRDRSLGQRFHVLRHLKAGEQFHIALRAVRVADHLRAPCSGIRRKLRPLSDERSPCVLFIRHTCRRRVCSRSRSARTLISLRVSLAAFSDIVSRYLVGTHGKRRCADYYCRRCSHYFKPGHVLSPEYPAFILTARCRLLGRRV